MVPFFSTIMATGRVGGGAHGRRLDLGAARIAPAPGKSPVDSDPAVAITLPAAPESPPPAVSTLIAPAVPADGPPLTGDPLSELEPPLPPLSAELRVPPSAKVKATSRITVP